MNRQTKILGGTVGEEDPLTYKCKFCDFEVRIADDKLTYDEMGYLCPKCHNFVALLFNGELLQPETVLNLDWNDNIKERATMIGEDLYVVSGSQLKDNLVLKILQFQPMLENSFHGTDPEEQPYLLVFDSENYLGFLVWDKDPHFDSDILQQIFIIDSKRRKGYGTKLLKYWVDNHAKKVEYLPDEYGGDPALYLGKFGIEITPDSPLWKILVNLKYAEIKDDRIYFVNFYRRPSF